MTLVAIVSVLPIPTPGTIAIRPKKCGIESSSPQQTTMEELSNVIPESGDSDQVIIVDTETVSTTNGLGSLQKQEMVSSVEPIEDEQDSDLESLNSDQESQGDQETQNPCRKVSLCVGERVVVGRASKTNAERHPEFDNLLFHNAHLSKVHAEIEYKPGFYIKDLGSSFGTVVNGLVLAPEEPLKLKDGDVIGLIMLKPSKKIAKVFDKFTSEKLIPLNEFGSPQLDIKKRVFIKGNTIEFYDVEGSIDKVSVDETDSALELVEQVQELIQLSESEVSESEVSESDFSSGDEISHTQIIFDSFSDDDASTPSEEETEPESRKRSRSDMENQDSFIMLVSENDEDLQQLLAPPPPPAEPQQVKRQKTNSWSVKTVLKEVGKAFFYTAATVAALGLYGSTIDPEK